MGVDGDECEIKRGKGDCERGLRKREIHVKRKEKEREYERFSYFSVMKIQEAGSS